MTFASNVAPPRRVRQKKREAWYCDCLVMEDQSRVLTCKQQPAALKRCLECLAVRP